MPSIVKQNPGSTEIKSPIVAGMSAGLNIISEILNLNTEELSNVPLTPVDSAGKPHNKNRIYETSMEGKLWLAEPFPIIKINGNPIDVTKEKVDIDYIGGSVEFERNLLDSEIVTADFTHIVGGSTEIINIKNSISDIGLKVSQYVGVFNQLSDLEADTTPPQKGNFAFVVNPDPTLYFMADELKYVNAQSEGMREKLREIDNRLQSIEFYFWRELYGQLKPETTATAGNGNAILSWIAVPSAKDYAIYEYKEEKYNFINRTGNTSYTISGLTNGKTYKFLVRAMNGSKGSAYAPTDLISVTPQA